MKKDDLLHLKIEEEEIGYSIKLDDKELHHVENYKIESSTLSGTVKLSIEVLVKYP